MPKTKILASSIIKIVPYIYLISPSTGREYQLRITDYLSLYDARMFLDLLGEEYVETPEETILALNLPNLLEIAQDWRFMNEEEITSFIARDIDKENGEDPYNFTFEDVSEDDSNVK